MHIRVIGTPAQVATHIAVLDQLYGDRMREARRHPLADKPHLVAFFLSVRMSGPKTVPASTDKPRGAAGPGSPSQMQTNGTHALMTNSTDPPTTPASADQRGLATADQCFDWTRRLTPPVRGLVTTWLEIGDEAMRHVSIVSPRRGAR